MKKIIIVLAVCAVLGVGAFFVIPMLNNDVTPPGPDVNPVISGDEVSKTVKVEPVKINNHADHITIENVYPKITSFNNKEFENYINKSKGDNAYSMIDVNSDIGEDAAAKIKAIEGVYSVRVIV